MALKSLWTGLYVSWKLNIVPELSSRLTSGGDGVETLSYISNETHIWQQRFDGLPCSRRHKPEEELQIRLPEVRTVAPSAYSGMS